MKPSVKTAFIGALIGSVAVLAALSLLVLVGQIPKAPFVGLWQATFGGGWAVAAVIGGLLFVLIGALWGIPFAWVPNPTVLKGILFGLLPTLWMWTAVAAYQGQPMFGGFTAMGLLLPIIMNCLIWGSILGWYCARHVATPAPPEAV